MLTEINVKQTGAAGNGIADDSEAIQKALDNAPAVVKIPAGNYRITKTLKVSSCTRIEADAEARIFSCSDTPKRQGDFLLTNRDHAEGNRDISICGGIWDGNHGGLYNTKNPDLFAPDAWSGTVLNFFNVNSLKLENLIVENSVVFHIRLGKIDNMLLRNIGFRGKPSGFNQDGLHFSGFCRNGLIENITALTKGQTTDDMIALNADDSLERLENRDLLRGPIENLTFRNIFAEDCHTGIRILSITAPVRNIIFENIRLGCRAYAVNMDAARYCRTPLFDPEAYPSGVGEIRNIIFDGMEVWKSSPECDLPLICNETNTENIIVRNFVRNMAADQLPSVPLIRTRNTRPGKNSLCDEMFSAPEKGF